VIDEDPIKRSIPTYEFEADLRITAGATEGVRALLAAIRPHPVEGREERMRRWTAASGARADAARRKAEALASRTPIDPVHVAHCIAGVIGDDGILVDDTLTHNPLHDYLALGGAGRYFRNPGSAGGWGPGFALGAKLGAPDRDVVLATGDGFWMYASPTAALWTARQYRAPFLSVVFVNRSYSTGTRAAAALYPDGYAVKGGLEGGYFDPPIDFGKEAEATGAYGETVRDPAEVMPALQRGLKEVRQNGRCAVISVWLKRLDGDD
jgi:acetolactate synthase-1/2/3 large subunit